MIKTMKHSTVIVNPYLVFLERRCQQFILLRHAVPHLHIIISLHKHRLSLAFQLALEVANVLTKLLVVTADLL